MVLDENFISPHTSIRESKEIPLTPIPESEKHSSNPIVIKLNIELWGKRDTKFPRFKQYQLLSCGSKETPNSGPSNFE